MVAHNFSLHDFKHAIETPYGTRLDAKKGNFPALDGMSLSILTLKPKGAREPHWHPNANELSYCLEGHGVMTIFNPGNNHESFSIEPGALFFVPEGSLHYIQNTGDVPLKMAICFSHEDPEDLELSTSIKVMPNHVLGATFKLPAEFFEKLKSTSKPKVINDVTPSSRHVPETNPYKFKIEARQPNLITAGGTVKMSNNFVFPPLKGLAMYSLVLNEGGVREPHWHPNAAELNVLYAGSARITLLTPSGEVDTFDMKTGDISYMPKGYIHHIENTGQEPAKFLVYFNHVTPSDIGLSGSLGAFDNDVLASLFKVDPSYFEILHKYQEDLLIVGGG